jgi:hypothetical protein
MSPLSNTRGETHSTHKTHINRDGDGVRGLIAGLTASLEGVGSSRIAMLRQVVVQCISFQPGY